MTNIKMPPKKGGKKKGGKKKHGEGIKRQLEFKREDEEYAKITKLLGDRRVKMTLADNRETLGLIPGKFRKRVWMRIGDIVLVNRRDYQDDKSDILLKYTSEEIKNLHRTGEIPDFFVDTDAKREEDFNEEDGIVMCDSDADDEPVVLRQEVEDNIFPPSESESEESDLNIDDI